MQLAQLTSEQPRCQITIAGGAKDVWIFQISKDVDLSAATNVILNNCFHDRVTARRILAVAMDLRKLGP